MELHTNVKEEDCNKFNGTFFKGTCFVPKGEEDLFVIAKADDINLWNGLKNKAEEYLSDKFDADEGKKIEKTMKKLNFEPFLEASDIVRGIKEGNEQF